MKLSAHAAQKTLKLLLSVTNAFVKLLEQNNKIDMKYLSDYTKDGISRALEFYGAFFAFSQDQFNAQKQNDTVYVNGPHGLICPKDNLDALMADLDRVTEAAIKQDMTDHTLNQIIIRELNNHECYYTGDIEDALPALLIYPGITREYVQNVFKNQNYEPVIS